MTVLGKRGQLVLGVMIPERIQHLLTSTALLWAAAGVIFMLVEIASGRTVSWRDRWLNSVNGALVVFTITLAAPAVAGAIAAGREALGFAAGPAISLPMIVPHPVLAALLFLFVHDFLYYWYHRLQHAWRPLWLIHSVHHSDTELNATSYVRQHVFDNVIHSFVVTVPLYLVVGVDLDTMVFIATIGVGVQFFIHANLPISFGPLSFLIASPLQHRVHHSTDAAASNANFASMFPVWDLAFGTYKHPTPTPATGLHSGEQHDSLQALLLAPFLQPPTTKEVINTK